MSLGVISPFCHQWRRPIPAADDACPSLGGGWCGRSADNRWLTGRDLSDLRKRADAAAVDQFVASVKAGASRCNALKKARLRRAGIRRGPHR